MFLFHQEDVKRKLGELLEVRRPPHAVVEQLALSALASDVGLILMGCMHDCRTRRTRTTCCPSTCW